jgi:fumarate hydratase class I
MIVARDLAHAKLRERLEAGEPLPDYIKNHPVYYAGPPRRPEGYASGSFGPTTAGRMDAYVDQFQAAGGSMVMLAKGNRSAQVRRACQAMAASISAPSAARPRALPRTASRRSRSSNSRNSAWRRSGEIEVEDFPAFIVVDDKGNDFFKELNRCVSFVCLQ